MLHSKIPHVWFCVCPCSCGFQGCGHARLRVRLCEQARRGECYAPKFPGYGSAFVLVLVVSRPCRFQDLRRGHPQQGRGHARLRVRLCEQARRGECYTPKFPSGRTKVWPLGAEMPGCEPFPPRVLATVGFPIGSRGVVSGRFKLVLYI